MKIEIGRVYRFKDDPRDSNTITKKLQRKRFKVLKEGYGSLFYVEFLDSIEGILRDLKCYITAKQINTSLSTWNRPLDYKE